MADRDQYRSSRSTQDAQNRQYQQQRVQRQQQYQSQQAQQQQAQQQAQNWSQQTQQQQQQVQYQSQQAQQQQAQQQAQAQYAQYYGQQAQYSQQGSQQQQAQYSQQRSQQQQAQYGRQRSQQRRVSSTQTRAQAADARTSARATQSGASYASNDARAYSRASYEQQYPQKKRRRNPVPIIIGALVAVLVVAGGAFALNRFVLNPTSNAQQDSAAATTSPSPSATMQVAEKEAAQQVGSERIAMTIKGDVDTVVFKGEEYIESGCTATDKEEGNITSKVETSGKVDTSTVGDYEITYKVQNSEGMERSRTRTVHVVDDLEKNTDGIPVCMYHYVYTEDDQPDSLDSNYILDTDLEEQLQYLTENDYYFPSFSELRAWIDGTHSLPSNCVILTFDDGEGGFLQYGSPLFEKYGVCVTSFLVCSDNIEPMTDWASDYISFQSHSYDMHHGGGSIGHGGVVSAMTQEEIRADLQQSVDMLGEKDAYAYPYGDTTEDAQAAVAEVGFLCAFTTEYGSVHQGDDVTLLPRIRVQGGNSLDSFIASV